MPVRVLFICVHNSARSQIAEEYMNRLGEGEFRALSAGLEPTEINPLVVEAMAEEGFDLSEKETNSVFEFYRRGKIFDVVVTVCEETTEEKCPVFPGVTHRLKLPFPDPEDFEGGREERLEKVRRLRDEIRESIREFIDWYEAGRNGPLSSRWEWPGRTED
jgi:arsenate reductase